MIFSTNFEKLIKYNFSKYIRYIITISIFTGIGFNARPVEARDPQSPSKVDLSFFTGTYDGAAEITPGGQLGEGSNKRKPLLVSFTPSSTKGVVAFVDVNMDGKTQRFAAVLSTRWENKNTIELISPDDLSERGIQKAKWKRPSHLSFLANSDGDPWVGGGRIGQDSVALARPSDDGLRIDRCARYEPVMALFLREYAAARELKLHLYPQLKKLEPAKAALAVAAASVPMTPDEAYRTVFDCEMIGALPAREGGWPELKELYSAQINTFWLGHMFHQRSYNRPNKAPFFPPRALLPKISGSEDAIATMVDDVRSAGTVDEILSNVQRHQRTIMSSYPTTVLDSLNDIGTRLDLLDENEQEARSSSIKEEGLKRMLNVRRPSSPVVVDSFISAIARGDQIEMDSDRSFFIGRLIADCKNTLSGNLLRIGTMYEGATSILDQALTKRQTDLADKAILAEAADNYARDTKCDINILEPLLTNLEAQTAPLSKRPGLFMRTCVLDDTESYCSCILGAFRSVYPGVKNEPYSPSRVGYLASTSVSASLKGGMCF